MIAYQAGGDGGMGLKGMMIRLPVVACWVLFLNLYAIVENNLHG